MLTPRSDVAGYPKIVHGGLTGACRPSLRPPGWTQLPDLALMSAAAILDETFGFLLYALKHHKQLPFWQPAFTAHLEVDYKAVRSQSTCRSQP